MDENVLLLSHSSYDFTDESTGKHIQGSTLWVLPINGVDDLVNGLKPVKYSIKDDVSEKLKYQKLPVLASMVFSVDFSRNKVIPTDFKDFKKINLVG